MNSPPLPPLLINFYYYLQGNLGYLKKQHTLLVILSMLIATDVCSQVKGPVTTGKAALKQVSVAAKLNHVEPAATSKRNLQRTGSDTLNISDTASYFKGLREWDFISGKLWFTGKGFPVAGVVSFSGQFPYPNGCEAYYRRCVPGTRILLTDGVFRNKEGILVRSFSKWITIR
jgi:hypothetical protein